MKKRIMCISAVVAVMAAAVGCENAEANKKSSVPESSQVKSEESITVEEKSKKHLLKHKKQRIIQRR